ncbi:MAG: ABC transporter permease [SAR324 cluster bacterium]|nr:ABC transporter permease [SAR324 cluster bacterium]MCZ6558530.1 ABC transporter permease [SAR324 cluster bacterium]MCZ6629080.1 ABC transporter permease [SAR324 cluster bacterium]
MGIYIFRRLALFVPTLIGVTIVIFVIMRVFVPGDIAELLVGDAASIPASEVQEQIDAIRAELELDKPYTTQYISWMKGLVQGDFGMSYWEKRPVSEIVGERFPRSLELAIMTLIIAMLWAVPLGVISAVKQNTWTDYVVRVISIAGLSLPLFLTGILIVYFLIRFFSWLPPLEFQDLADNPLENFQQMIWPALAQAFYISAPITRLTRSQMLDVIREDYVRTARAKGLRERVVIYHHALGNALLPVVTFIGWWGGRLLGGIIIMELIFGIPGMGTSLIDAVSHRDYPTVQAIVFIMALVFLLLNLIIDLLYAWMDPRIRYA